jgi:hypothetical protein
LQDKQIVFGVAKHCIAMLAKQPPYFACFMAMVNKQFALQVARMCFTDFASVILLRQHFPVRISTNAV